MSVACLWSSQQGASACFWNRPPGGLTCRRCSLTSAKEWVPRGNTAYLPLEAIFNWNPAGGWAFFHLFIYFNFPLMMGARIQRKIIQAEFLKNKTKQRNIIPDFLCNVQRIKQRVHLMVRLCVCARVCVFCPQSSARRHAALQAVIRVV